MADYYEILGVPRTATTAEVRQRLRASWPASGIPTASPTRRRRSSAQEFFKEVTAAFNALSNDRSRPRVRRELDRPDRSAAPEEIARDAYERGLEQFEAQALPRGGGAAAHRRRTTRPARPRYHAALGRGPGPQPALGARGASRRWRRPSSSQPTAAVLPRASWRSCCWPRASSCARAQGGEAALRLDPHDATARRVLEAAGSDDDRAAATAGACGACCGASLSDGGRALAGLTLPGVYSRLSNARPSMKITYQALTDVGPQAQGQRGQPLRQPRAEPLRGGRRHGRPRRGRDRLQGRGGRHQRVRLPDRRRRGDHLALRPRREHLLRRQPAEDGHPLRQPQGPGGHARRRPSTRAWPPRWPPCWWTATPPTWPTSATAASTSCARASSSQLTSDHSWVNEQIQSGVISADQARSHPLRNVVTRALGGKADLQVDMQVHEIEPGDILLLCSDGLTTMIPDDEIARVMREARGRHREGGPGPGGRRQRPRAARTTSRCCCSSSRSEREGCPP